MKKIPNINTHIFKQPDLPWGTLSSLSFEGITNFIYFGDSIINGSNATAGNSYRELLSTNYATTNTNYASSGRGVWREVKNSVPISYTRSSTVMFESAGLNDLRRNSTQACFNKIESCLNSMIAKHFVKTTVFAGSSNTTRVGIWTSVDLTPFGGSSNSAIIGTPTASAISSTSGDTCSWTFTNDNVYVTFSASDITIARSNVEVRIDGGLVETITDLDNRYDATSDGEYDNKRGPDTRFYFDLGSGSHTIEIKLIESKTLTIDTFGTLESPSNLGNLFVLQIPYIVDYTKIGLDQANDSVINQANTLREEVVNRFKSRGYKIRFAKVMQGNGGFYSLENVDSIDGVHPTNAGHLQIYNSIIRYIN